jgi:ribonuclease P/MRP protein subunit POP5
MMTTPLPPSLREKRRYILVKAVTDMRDVPDARQVYYAISEAADSLYGDTGMAWLQPVVVFSSDLYFIVRCRRGGEGLLEAALAGVSRTGDMRITLRTIATSGTIRSLRERMSVQAAGPWEETVFGDTEYLMRTGPRQRVDLFEKGIKSQKVLFLIQNDIEGI